MNGQSLAHLRGTCGIHIPRVEQDQGIGDQAEGAELAALAAQLELPGPAMEDLLPERVAALLKLGVHLDLPALAAAPFTRPP